MQAAIEARRSGLLTYGITPPKASFSPEKRREVAHKQSERIRALPIDGLVIYDLQDESERTPEARPFPFLETVEPLDYAYRDLASLTLPKVTYCCVAKHDRASLSARLERIRAHAGLCTFVGAASRRQPASLRLPDAYALHRESFADVPLGGVLIAERHGATPGEDERVVRKMRDGCSFFITQAVYSVVASKNVLSDLYYRAQASNQPLPPILVTLSPCGSLKTLQFMRWLGISAPRWLENELTHAQDILETSLRICSDILADLAEFCRSKHIPLGCNVESVSLRKEEIDASVELVHRAHRLLGR